MSVDKRKTGMIFTGKDVNGKNFVDCLQNTDCSRITMESIREPSKEFCNKIREFGFNVKVKPLSRDVHNILIKSKYKFRITLTRKK